MVYHLVICEIFNELMHGYDETSDSTVLGNYLVIDKIDYSMSDCNEYIDDVIECHNKKYKQFIKNKEYKKYKHPFIRNYNNIIERQNYIKMEIAQCIYLSGNECVAILKTFWIKIIQRKWKKVFKLRQECIERRKSIGNLMYRETTGKWNRSCIMPPFRLFDLSN